MGRGRRLLHHRIGHRHRFKCNSLWRISRLEHRLYFLKLLYRIRQRARGHRRAVGNKSQHGIRNKLLLHRQGQRHQKYRRADRRFRIRHRYRYRKLLGYPSQQPEHQRRRHGTDHQRTPITHRLHRHIRRLERQPRRAIRQRRPLGFRHIIAVPRA